MTCPPISGQMPATPVRRWVCGNCRSIEDDAEGDAEDDAAKFSRQSAKPRHKRPSEALSWDCAGSVDDPAVGAFSASVPRCDAMQDILGLLGSLRHTRSMRRHGCGIPGHSEKGTRIMAQQTTVTLTDDIDGGRAAETVSFGLDGRIYEIDLSKKNAAALRKALGDFTSSGRRVRGARAAARAARSSSIVDA